MLLNVFELFWPAHPCAGASWDTWEDRRLQRPFREWETARNMKTPVDHQHAESEGRDVLAVYPDSSVLFDF
ncbi:hypothetical protein B0H14DRAFT_2950015 [Mycena olivaceomarginata]|nr:hypothetical protein B0H14DRAFT_2950015 [Mycena olivaceomarginata]